MRLFKKFMAVSLAAAVALTSVEMPVSAAARTESAAEFTVPGETGQQADGTDKEEPGTEGQPEEGQSDTESKDQPEEGKEDTDGGAQAEEGKEDTDSKEQPEEGKEDDGSEDTSGETDKGDTSDVNDTEDPETDPKETEEDNTEDKKPEEADDKKTDTEEKKKEEKEVSPVQAMFDKAAAENGTITLSEDMTADEVIMLKLPENMESASVVLELNGHSLTTDKEAVLLAVEEGVSLTVSGEGSLVNQADNGVVIYNKGSLKLDGSGILASGANSIGVLNDSSQGDEGFVIIKGSVKAGWLAVGKTAKAVAAYSRQAAFFGADNPASPVSAGNIESGGYQVDENARVVDEGPATLIVEEAGSDKAIAGVPGGVQAQIVNDSTISLTWSAVAGATGYSIYRSTDGSNFAKIGQSVQVSYSDSNLITGTTYYYQVAALDNSGEGARSTPISIALAYTAPVGMTAAAAGYNVINISWQGVNGASEYSVYRSAAAETGYVKIGTATTTGYQDTAVVPGITYFYKTAVTKGSYTGPLSSFASAKTVLNTPDNVKAVKKTSDTADITWNNVEGATRYGIYRSTLADGPYARVGESVSNSYTASGLIPGQTYYFKVSALNASQDSESALSGQTSVKTSITKPTKLKASSNTYNSIKLTWNKVAGANKYEVYRSTKKNSGFVKVATVSKNEYISKKLKTGTTYYFKVKAKSDFTRSGFSARVSGKSSMGAPKGIKAASSNYNSIKITWEKVYGAKKYDVYRSTNKKSGFKKIKTVTGTTYTDKKLSTGKTYYYKIKAMRTSKIISKFSGVASAKPTPPATPKFTAASEDYNKVKLTWKKRAGVTKYMIYRSTKKNSDFKKIKTISDLSTLTYIDSGLTNGKTYYYKIVSYTKNVKGGTKTASAVPMTKVPEGVEIDNLSTTSIKLTWKQVNGATSYKVYRSTSPDSGFQVMTTDEEKFVDRNLSLGTMYYYKVQSVRNGVDGGITGVIGLKATIPGVQNLSIKGIGDNRVELSWDENEEASGYKIYRSTIADSGYRYLATITDNIYINTISPGKTYYFRVTALSNDLESNPKQIAYGLPSGIKLNKTSATLRKGETLQLEVTFTPSDAADKTIKWSTSNKKIASVSDKGLVTMLGVGTATITATTVNGKTATCEVKNGGKIVVLDPGHGGSDAGAVAGGAYEKVLNLKISQYTKEQLEKYEGVTVHMTRTGDSYVGLEERAQIAHSYDADILVSQHLNSGVSAAKGSEVYVSLKDGYNAASTSLGSKILSNLSGAGFTNRGVKTRRSSDGVSDYYAVIRHSVERGFPGIIVEGGFMTNSSDMNILSKESGLKSVGVATADAIASYYGLKKK